MSASILSACTSSCPAILRILPFTWQCHKLSGHMSVGARDKVLQAFKEDPEVKVLLISLKAGGVALNLTHANHIYLMGTWVGCGNLKL